MYVCVCVCVCVRSKMSEFDSMSGGISERDNASRCSKMGGEQNKGKSQLASGFQKKNHPNCVSNPYYLGL